MTDILAVDVDSILRPLWEGMGDAALTDATPEAYARIIRERESFDRVVLALDVGKSFRVLAEPSYKANRRPPPEAYRYQRRALVARLNGSIGALYFASPVLETIDDVKYYGEADDVLGSAAAWFQGLDSDTRGRLRVFSGDTDLWALVNDDFRIDLMTPDGVVVSAREVVARFGVPPHLVSEVRALAGDDADNYHPFLHPEKTARGAAMPGIGGKTAAAIVLAPGGVDAVMRAVLDGTEPPIKLSENVIACLRHGGLPALERGRTCARLRILPLDFSKVLDEPQIGAPAAPQAASTAPQAAPAVAPSVVQVSEPSTAMAIPTGSTRDLTYQRTGLDPYALEPNTLDAAMYLAGEMFRSGGFGKLPNPAAVLAIMLRARVLGIPSATASDYFDFVEGKASWKAQGMLGYVKGHPLCRQLEFDWPRCSEDRAVLLFQRVGERAGEYVFSLEMARIAGFTDGKASKQWLKRPGVMLRWASVRELVRAVWPDVIGGLYTREDDDDDEAEALPEMVIEQEPRR